MTTRVLVVGVGGLGGVVGAHLVEQAGPLDLAVTALSRNEAVRAAVARGGLRLRDEVGERVVAARVDPEVPQGEGPFDWIVLATQPPDLEEAAAAAVPHLAPGGSLVVLQNGLCEARVAAIAGEDRVVGAVVSFGASMPEPGLAVRTSSGGFTLGRPDGSERGLGTLAVLLEPIGPVEITHNLPGVRWSKLAINCAISTLGTIGGDRLGVLLRHRFVRRLALEVITETVEVARREGIVLEKVSGSLDLEWLALAREERRGFSPTLVAKHALMLAVGARYRNLRSSMLYALERGKEPAVDFLNGEVVERGRRHGVPCPVNEAAQAMVHRIAAGEATSSVETLGALTGAMP